ncbi:hypothetical protein K5L81_003891 [Salmonella enterica]|nr:hypothetical protein [Salmonella enterica]EHZ2289065.1 hypothetical protein [Salmonella enterica]
MANNGFNSKDIEEFVARHTRVRNKKPRKTTSGIPCFVPREPAIQSIVNTPQNEEVWAAAADRAEQQQEQELPPASPCFSQADIDEFLARKPKKYQMTERDYKELGRNVFLGVGDLITSTAKLALYGAQHIPVSPSKKDDDKILYYTTDGDGWGHAWSRKGKKF